MARKQRMKEVNLSGTDYLARKAAGQEFRMAFLSETMGPNYPRELFWLHMNDGSKRPLVRTK